MKLGPIIGIGLLATAIFLILSRTSRADGLRYMEDWKEAQKSARSGGRPILLNFGGPW